MTVAAASSFFFLITLLASAGPAIGLSFGINYGQIANNLPSPSRVSGLLRSLNITRVKLYNADPHVLSAFADSEVDFIVGLGNEYLVDMTDPIKAQDWINQHVQPFIGRTGISCVVVGNEVFNTNNTQWMTNLLPAMQTIYTSLSNLGMERQVTVTSAHTLNILGTSYPPSSGTFRQDLLAYIKPLLDFHSQIKSSFLVNAYPFFAYMYSPNEVSLDYASSPNRYPIKRVSDRRVGDHPIKEEKGSERIQPFDKQSNRFTYSHVKAARKTRQIGVWGAT